MSTLLKTDEQTMSDLSIFGRSGKASIFDLYNKTTTQGGSARLNHLFRHPLSDEKLINEKAAIFRFFASRELLFPVDSESIGGIVYYLQNDDVRSQLQLGGQSFGQLFKDMVAADASQVFVNDGVQAVLRMFYKLDQFTKQLSPVVEGSAYALAFEKLEDAINAQELALVRQHFSSKFEVKLSPGVLSELDKLVRFEQREKLLFILDLLYDLDVYVSVGQVARKRGFNFAKAMPKESGTLLYEQVYHPQVEGAIANDIHLNFDSNVLFLTGANMAGKSTLMKSIGIALYLAHMGFPVAARRFEFSVRDGIFTSINLADNLSMGASHYYAEVLRVKEVAQALSEGKQLFVIFDEMFRGTNVKDAYDATIAITKAFCKKSGSQFIISTHIMEAGEILQKETLPIKYQYLPTEMKGGAPVYTRVLKDGITADRQGMIIIQNEGILEMLDAGLKRKEE
ncbi:MutS-related protein [Pseudoflavitalea rhizosphaerae]|uniref:MutS-related protein n=1 Tax=Pseudoflavitalea rhizosphaerae TaxID=1884793 RepID=UPI000F8D89AA|nr:DNA mismatch repair protein [Pseudoflavitalea rhizosphaerae]